MSIENLFSRIIVCKHNNIFGEILEKFRADIPTNYDLTSEMIIEFFIKTKIIKISKRFYTNSIDDETIYFTESNIEYYKNLNKAIIIANNYCLDDYLSMTIEEIFNHCRLLDLFN
jgi:hypothetical protein